MVKLVDNDDVEMLRIDASDAARVQALDRREDVLEPIRPVASNPFLAERRIAQDMTEGGAALIEDLLAMRDE